MKAMTIGTNAETTTIQLGVFGERFLRLAEASEFSVTVHALDRLEQRLGFRPTRALAHLLFSRARQVRIDDLRLLGYRPRYETRVARGERTWYFRFRVFGQELIAVVAEDRAPGRFVWVTTYGRDASIGAPKSSSCQVQAPVVAWRRKPAVAA